MSEASPRDWLRRLVRAINATTNPPETAVEPGGARSSSHDVLRAPSGSDHPDLRCTFCEGNYQRWLNCQGWECNMIGPRRAPASAESNPVLQHARAL